MYTPTEDSFMLENEVKKHAFGKVLDIGTGIGIQAMAAASLKQVSSVLAVDIDKEAIDYCKENIKDKKINFIVSDLFENVKDVFDVIIFNPPYLPQDKGIKDKALYGGKHGYEIIERFMKQAEKYLGAKGIILMVFSSLTNRKKVDAIVKNCGFEFKELSRAHEFFEDIYVYEINRG